MSVLAENTKNFLLGRCGLTGHYKIISFVQHRGQYSIL